jgi:DNA-binding XRE family transcriptional regulator
MDLGLTQKAAAKVIGTNAWSLRDWEENRRSIVRPMFYPGIIDFLGYNPLATPTTVSEAIRGERLVRGWSLERLAKVARVDPATVRRIEAGRPRLVRRSLKAVCIALQIRL